MIDVLSSNPISNIGEIRRRHIDLMNQSLDPAAPPILDQEIIDFINTTAAVGAALEARDSRSTAQDIIDYWRASLLSVRSPDILKKARSELTQFSGNLSKVPFENPFRFIGAFGKGDNALLSAREEEIGAVVKKIREHRVVFITHPSGSGRSVLVTIGAVTRLTIAKKNPYKVLQLSSLGSNPVLSLQKMFSIHSTTSDELQSSLDLLRQNVRNTRGDREAMFLIDKAEELFTRCSDHRLRERFATAIASIVAEPGDDRVIMIVSDEQAEALFSLEALKPYATKKSAHLSLPPLSAQEIQRAIAVQSNDAGLRIDAEVAGDLAREIQGEPAAFSLAHFMLFHLWPLSKDGFIGWDDYKKLGRPNEALARIAEDTFKSLSAEEQDAAKRLFLMLAAPGIDTTATSRSVRRTDLLVSNPDVMTRVLQLFEDQGLLRRSMRPDSDPDAIKMVSDRLMYRWNRLGEWLAGQRRNSERRLQVLATARLWDRSDRSSGYLFTDKKSIDDARKYIDSSAETDTVREFVDASDKALTKKERLKLYTTLGIAIALLSVLVWIVWHHWYQKELIAENVQKFKNLSREDDLNGPVNKARILAERHRLRSINRLEEIWNCPGRPFKYSNSARSKG